MTFRYCQLFTLGGCYGRVVNSNPLFEQKKGYLSIMKQGLEASKRLIDKQMILCNQFASTQYGNNDSPMAKKLSFIAEEDLSSDHDQIIEALRKKTQFVQSQHSLAVEYLQDIEGSLETWSEEIESQSGTFNVQENVDEDDQVKPVRELIMIDRSMGKLVILLEKIDLLIEKNDRLLNKATLKVKSESLLQHSESLISDLSSQKKQAVKVEEKIKAHHASLQKKVATL